MRKSAYYIVILVFGGMQFYASNATGQSNEWEVPSKFQKLKNPFTGVEDAEKTGKTLYIRHCSSCHGKKGLGDGVKARSLKTPMPDFSQDSFQKQADGTIYFKSIIGRDEMPGYEKRIRTEKERWLLINYMRTLKAK